MSDQKDTIQDSIEKYITDFLDFHFEHNPEPIKKWFEKNKERVIK